MENEKKRKRENEKTRKREKESSQNKQLVLAGMESFTDILYTSTVNSYKHTARQGEMGEPRAFTWTYYMQRRNCVLVLSVIDHTSN